LVGKANKQTNKVGNPNLGWVYVAAGEGVGRSVLIALTTAAAVISQQYQLF